MLASPPTVPAACISCAEVVSVVDAMTDARCPRCARPVTKYWSDADSPPMESDDDALACDDIAEARLTRSYACPRCHTEQLTFALVGLWD